MNLSTISWLLTLTIVFSPGCETTSVYQPKMEIVKSQIYTFVPMSKLIEQMSKFHGQYIETIGHFHYAYEECAIYYDIELNSNDTIMKVRDYCGLWIDFHTSLPEYQSKTALDSIQDKPITVRGLFDTIQVPIMRCFRANLRYAHLVENNPKSK